jgi:hypothetical protein
VADLIGAPVRARVLRGGESLEVELVPSELSTDERSRR